MIYNLDQNETLQFSNDMVTVEKEVNNGIEYYSSHDNSTLMDFSFVYYRVHNLQNNSYSSWKNISTEFSQQARTAKYSIENKTNAHDIIYSSFDQISNIWYYNGSAGLKIHGTIAYDGNAKNIEVTIPSNGLNLSEMITINGRSFQLRCGPYRVSIKASQNTLCDNTLTMFAFAVN